MLKLTLWKETLTLDEAFKQIQADGLDSTRIVRELGKTLIIKKCLQEFGIETPDTASQVQLLGAFRYSMKLSSAEAFDKWLSQNHLTEEQLLLQLAKNAQVERLQHTLITDQIIRETFLKRKSRLDQIIFSMIRVKQEAQAKILYLQLVEGKADFSELAKLYSMGPEAQGGGRIGPRNPLGLNAELYQVLLKLQPGEITKPFSLDGKQHLIVRLEQDLPTSLTPQMITQIRQELFDQWLDRQMQLAGVGIIQEEVQDKAIA